MVLIDYLIVVIFFLSVMIGFFRGFTLEFLSLVSWVFSFWAAFYFMGFLEVFYRPYIEFGFLRAISSFISILIPLLILCGITSRILGAVIRSSAYGGLDRTAGATFGFLRSSIIVLLFLFFLRIFFSNAVWWQDSIVIPLFVKVLDSLELFFPDTFDRDAFI